MQTWYTAAPYEYMIFLTKGDGWNAKLSNRGKFCCYLSVSRGLAVLLKTGSFDDIKHNFHKSWSVHHSVMESFGKNINGFQEFMHRSNSNRTVSAEHLNKHNTVLVGLMICSPKLLLLKWKETLLHIQNIYKKNSTHGDRRPYDIAIKIEKDTKRSPRHYGYT